MTKQTLYRKAIVKRINPAQVAKFGEQAFDGLFKLDQTTDTAIVIYFAGKMAEEGYTQADYSIELTTVTIDDKGKAQKAA